MTNILINLTALATVTVTWTLLVYILSHDLRRHQNGTCDMSVEKWKPHLDIQFWGGNSLAKNNLLCNFSFQLSAAWWLKCVFFSFVLIWWGSTNQSTRPPEHSCQDYSLNRGLFLHNRECKHISWPCENSVYLGIGKYTPFCFSK